MSSAFDASKLSTRPTNPDADGIWSALHRLASPPAERRERRNLPQKSAKHGAGLSCLQRPSDRPPYHLFSIIAANRPVRWPLLAARVTALVRSFPEGLPPNEPDRTDNGHCAQLIVAFEAVLHAPRASSGRNLLRPPDSTTKRKEAEGRRSHALRPMRRQWRANSIELSVVKTAVVVALSNVSERFSVAPQDRTQTVPHAARSTTITCQSTRDIVR